MSATNIYSAIVFFDKGIRCVLHKVNGSGGQHTCDGTPINFYTNAVLCSTNAILNLLVAAFTMCLFFGQLLLIKQNRSFIDNLQKRKSNYGIELELASRIKNDQLNEFQQKNFYHKLSDVMGDRNILWWLLPVYRHNDEEFHIENELC